MALTPQMLTTAVRRAGVLAAFATAFALTGPFRYGDLGLPFPDTVAHGLLFYGLTLVLVTSLPRSRASELVLAMVGVGAASEVAQMAVGREASLHDFVGDCAGVALAYAPVLAGRLRAMTRSHPHVSFAELRRRDRRRSPRAAAGALDPADA